MHVSFKEIRSETTGKPSNNKNKAVEELERHVDKLSKFLFSSSRQEQVESINNEKKQIEIVIRLADTFGILYKSPWILYKSPCVNKSQ